MTTNNERREVARRLRKVNPYRNQSHTIPCNRYIPAAEYLSELAGALGYSPKNDVSRLEFQSRLADLIEPVCDRDALLEIIEDLNICLEHAGPDIEREYVQLVRDRLLKACGGVISGEPDQH